ncbi:hypothetical protein GMORB2_6853 [Geosmithia morbida]|uniref:Uncharacterized protein n=1 Tax=Geosmithia morbida TaxID=1094350 RepID=A0A9P5D498_9HYPO|nr:uncharacterized protein GMORB2_6853 [Geosmithia morbida]KAF4123301.1 hypothetical protein GMORB2_6853 [Geosmithia morbida]
MSSVVTRSRLSAGFGSRLTSASFRSGKEFANQDICAQQTLPRIDGKSATQPPLGIESVMPSSMMA